MQKTFFSGSCSSMKCQRQVCYVSKSGNFQAFKIGKVLKFRRDECGVIIKCSDNVHRRSKLRKHHFRGSEMFFHWQKIGFVARYCVRILIIHAETPERL